jgi:hypothetical protein
MNWLLPALQTAKSQGWISDETAMKVMFEYCGEEVDIHEELRKIANQPNNQFSDYQEFQRTRYPEITKANKPDGPVVKSPTRKMDGQGRKADQTGEDSGV